VIPGFPMTAPGLNNATAVVLAGGWGTRLRRLAPGVPKPMIAVCGRPFVEWVIRHLRRQGVRHVVLATGFRSEVVERHFVNEPVAGVRIMCVAEPAALGTGGGFLHAARHCGADPEIWIVPNGDSLVLTDFAEPVRLLGAPEVQGVLVGVPVPDASRYGTLSFNGRKRLTGFEEKKTGAGVISAGLYLLKPSLLAEFPPVRPLSFEHEVFPHWLARGLDLRVHVTQAPFLDMGTPESLPLAEPFVANHLLPLETL
jgi:D-glycero-alpha-D-manno-heptose 1-phosphate guanylyltransferase